MLELISGDRLRTMAPALSRDYRHGVLYPDCGHVLDPRALVRALGQSALDRGARADEVTAPGAGRDDDGIGRMRRRRFHMRVGNGRGRIRRIAIVALARKLLVALWRYVTQGVIPDGATLKAT